MNIKVKIETIKSQMTIEFSPATIKNQYNALLDVIRDMEFKSEEDMINAKINILDDTLDLLGTMMLAAEGEEDVE